MNNRRRFNITMGIISAVLLAILAGLLWHHSVQEKLKSEQLQQMAEEKTAEGKELEETSMLTLFWDDNIDLLDGIDAKCIVDYDTLSNNASYTSGYRSNASVSFTVPNDTYSVDESKLYMLVFEAYSEKSAVEIVVQLDGVSSIYYLTCEPCAFYLPISDLSSFDITLKSDFQNTYIGNVAVIETNGLGSNIKYGQYDLTDIELYENTVNNLLVDEAGRDILIDGNYAYYLMKNKLVVYEINGTGLNEVGSVSGIGNTRNLAFVNENVLASASRENDVFFIDVTNPHNPSIISSYDSLDLATGIAFCENYMFVCSRYFGVEIVDITDVSNPQLTSIVSSGQECLDCTYSEGYLYVSNWNAKMVYVYDVSNPNQPNEVSTIDVDGNPCGIDVDGEYLYVATGHDSANERSDILDGGYGAGHGMEIYDISDVGNIKWQSTVKVDGRVLYRADDHWAVYLNGNYVFLASTYAGVYIYDITNSQNPIRKGHISTKIYSSSEDYGYTSSDKNLFPYNPEEYIEDPISAVAFDDGVIYMAASATGLYALEYGEIREVENETEAALPKYDGSYFEAMKDISVSNSVLYNNGVSVNAADVSGAYVYIACGDAGIEVINNDGKLLNSVTTKGAAQDIIVNGQYCYVAEGNYGIEVYKLDGTDMKLISSYKCSLLFETVTQIRIANGYLIAQVGWTRYRLFDVSDPYNITSIQDGTTGTMYLKNLINTGTGSTVLGFESGREVKLFSIAQGIQEIGAVTNSIAGERNGMCEYNGNIIAVYNNGYTVFSADDVAKGVDLSAKTVYKLGDKYKLKGKVTCSDNVMVVTNATDKQVNIVDITDITSPKITHSFNVSGNPLVAKITEDYIYIPLCWQGLLIMER